MEQKIGVVDNHVTKKEYEEDITNIREKQDNTRHKFSKLYEDINEIKNKLLNVDTKIFFISVIFAAVIIFSILITGKIFSTYVNEKENLIIEYIDSKISDITSENETNAGISKAIYDAVSNAIADSKETIMKDEAEALKTSKKEPDEEIPDIEESDLDVISVTPEEYDLICKCVQTEAGEWAEGSRYPKKEYYNSKVAVCNVILNLSEMKGLSITDTICYNGRFEVWPGMMSRCKEISEQTKKAVNSVLSGKNRDTRVNCFRSKYYHGWIKDPDKSTPENENNLYDWAGNYFSHYDE